MKYTGCMAHLIYEPGGGGELRTDPEVVLRGGAQPALLGLGVTILSHTPVSHLHHGSNALKA